MNEVARKAFHELKKAVMGVPVLDDNDTVPFKSMCVLDPNKECLCKMDALKLGLGTVL